MSGSEMQAKFARLVALGTEDYLIRYANKGLYNRALKDMEKGVSVQYAFTENAVVCTLSDGTVCTLTDSIESFTCSCPSDKICKHVLIGILDYPHVAGGGAEAASVDPGHAKEPETLASASAKAELSAAPEPPTLDFGWLTETEMGALVSSFPAARVEEAAFRLRYIEELDVREGSLLVVQMKRSGVEVAFTDTPEVDRALCAVPGADGEMYKLEALLRYRASKGLDDSDELAAKLSRVEFPPETLEEFRDSIGELLRNGLARLPHSFADRFELLAIAARSSGLPNLEREARGIHGELELFFARHVRFSTRVLLSRLSRVSLMLDALEREIGPARRAQLAGRFRGKYYTVPRLDLYALGAEPWETRSGYRGITYYFYCGEDGGLYTYSQARPAYYEGSEFNFSRHYRERSPWKPDLSMKDASSSMLSFRAVKVSGEGRLSAGGSPALTLPERPGVESFGFGNLRAASFAELASEPVRVGLFGGLPRRFKLLRAAAIESSVYDRASQTLKFTVVDAAGDRLELILPYHADWSTAINRLESGRGLPSGDEFHIFASIGEEGVYPISFLQGNRLLNLKLDG
ncbi:hypothetical protein [Saccharibacillus sacchari]|uniref:Uncharacterized protein n=1 Tax=Saccharibacillus sacchari TaxID=456493 RepID=A0ACC6PD47_9BACL